MGEEPIDIRATLKHFSRNTLIRMTVILSLHYGNMCFPDNQNTLFSEESSKKHIPYLNKLFTAYYKRLRLQQGQKIEILTYRTSLELWRHIFAIPVEEFTNDIDESDIELVIFKVVLSINEQIVNFTHKEEHYKTEELIFLSGFLTNDGNNYDLKILQSQSYYFHQLINFIPSNDVLRKATEVLFENWGIDNWQQYYWS